MLSSKALVRIACCAAFALLFGGCKGGSWGATPSLDPARMPTVEMPSPLQPDAKESLIYAFEGGRDGAHPTYALASDKRGSLYGTTEFGGDTRCYGGYGCGTVFKLTRSGGRYTKSIIYRFHGGHDGTEPRAGVIVDATGTLYGTTSLGGGGASCGSYGCGTFFKLAPSGSNYKETVLYTFSHGSPPSSLVADKTGAFYGTTEGGEGTGFGTVFKLTPYGSSYTESILHAFAGYPKDGALPGAGLITDKAGELYGTTVTGGRYCPGGSLPGCGTAFELKPSKSGYTYRVIHNFRGKPDVRGPYGVLLVDNTGALFGESGFGGHGPCSIGCGTVFRLKPAGNGYTERLLHSFQNSGESPAGGVIADATGALYGTNANGGNGAGSVFKLTPSGKGYAFSILHEFQGGQTDGANPYAGLLLKNGVLYGETSHGGPYHPKNCLDYTCGTVFKLTP